MIKKDLKVSKNKINCIFSPKDLHISNFCRNFAVEMKSN